MTRTPPRQILQLIATQRFLAERSGALPCRQIGLQEFQCFLIRKEHSVPPRCGGQPFKYGQSVRIEVSDVHPAAYVWTFFQPGGHPSSFASWNSGRKRLYEINFTYQPNVRHISNLRDSRIAVIHPIIIDFSKKSHQMISFNIASAMSGLHKKT